MQEEVSEQRRTEGAAHNADSTVIESASQFLFNLVLQITPCLMALKVVSSC